MSQLLVISLLSLAAGSAADGGLALEQKGSEFVVTGGHFALTIDAARGGEVTTLSLHDGAAWNAVLGDATFPAFTLSDAAAAYALARDGKAVSAILEQGPDKVRLSFTGYPRTPKGEASAWQVCLTYEIYREGAVFVDVQCHLREGAFALHGAEVSFQAAESILKAPKFSDENVGLGSSGFRSGRIAFGMNPAKSFTNELEMVCEYKQAIVGDT